jgi:N-acetylmuramoyl-L-alanine amidase
MMRHPVTAPRNTRRPPRIIPLPEFIQYPSPNYNQRARPIRFIMLHYTAILNPMASLRVLSDPAPRRANYLADMPPETPVDPAMTGMDPAVVPPADPPSLPRVSSHYMIHDDGRIFQMVQDEDRAWHAGSGGWGGETTDMNSASIGIEINNGGHPFGLPPYPEVQIESVMALVKHLMERHGLGPQAVIGHSDHAPSRKSDPGEHFPWKRLADAGLAIWCGEGATDGDHRVLFDTMGQQDRGLAVAQTGLATIGYPVVVNGTYDQPFRDVVVAFQRRFRQDKVDGFIDVDTLGRISRLVQQWTGRPLEQAG